MDNFKGNRASKKEKKNRGYELNGKFSSKHIRISKENKDNRDSKDKKPIKKKSKN
jgi:hypothetical protein